jgi:hypothetical protein
MSVNHDSLSILHSHLKKDLVLALGSVVSYLLPVVSESGFIVYYSVVRCLKSDVRKSRFIVYTSFSSEAGFSLGSWLLVLGSVVSYTIVGCLKSEV